MNSENKILQNQKIIAEALYFIITKITDKQQAESWKYQEPTSVQLKWNFELLNELRNVWEKSNETTHNE